MAIVNIFLRSHHRRSEKIFIRRATTEYQVVSLIWKLYTTLTTQKKELRLRYYIYFFGVCRREWKISSIYSLESSSKCVLAWQYNFFLRIYNEELNEHKMMGIIIAKKCGLLVVAWLSTVESWFHSLFLFSKKKSAAAIKDL